MRLIIDVGVLGILVGRRVFRVGITADRLVGNSVVHRLARPWPTVCQPYTSDVHDFLIQKLHTSVLDELYSKLWWVGRKDSAGIDPLNRQRVKGWEIVPTEDPNLHLVR